MSIANVNREHKERLYELFAMIGAALANPHRLEILDLLTQAPHTVEELANLSHMSIANTSQHLQRLKKARLVTDKHTGQYIRYQLADISVMNLWLSLRGVADQQLGEVDRALKHYRPNRDRFRRISLDELNDQAFINNVFIIDVRPTAEFQAGHLPNARSFPIESFEDLIDQIPKEKTIVAYCRGPYCVYADQALEILTKRGWQVARLEEGVAEWQEAGKSLER